MGDGMNKIVKFFNYILSLCSVDTVCKYIFWMGMWALNALCYETDTAWFKISVAMLVIDTAMFICYMYGKHTGRS